MNDIDKRDGLQQIIDTALESMGHDRKSKDFNPKDVNLAQFCRMSNLTRSKARTLQKKDFRAIHGRCGKKAQTTVISGFEEELDGLLRKRVTNSVVCLERIQDLGYTGGLTTVKGYIKANSHLIPAPRRLIEKGASRGQRFKTEPGEAYQMDWGFLDVEDPAGNIGRMACFCMVCHHCGTFYVEFFPNARQENLFIGMIHAFIVMGVPEKILTDNMKSVVTCRNHEGRPVWNSEYEAFMDAIGFKTKLCKPYHPWTKGKCERLVRFVKENFMAGRTFTNLTDLNLQALEWCSRKSLRFLRSPGIIPSEEHNQACLAACHELIKTTEVAMYLCPVRKISFDGFVSYEGRRFGVPWWYEGKSCRVNRDGYWLHIYSEDMSIELAVHSITWKRHDSTCPDQWLEPDCPEELPTAPVKAKILQIEAPEKPGGLERFDFRRLV